jgi:DNA-binding MarR family transcriptional regulator
MPTTDLTQILIKLVRQLTTLNTQYLDHLGLGTGQAAVLKAISTHYGITEVELTRILKIDKSTVSRAVNRLVEVGYVQKKPNPRDLRSHHLLVTKMAAAFEPLFKDVDQSVAKALLQGLNQNQIDEFGRYLSDASARVDHVLHSAPVSEFQRYIPRAEY